MPARCSAASGLAVKQSLPPLSSLPPKKTPPVPLEGWPVLRLGFRPFYLGAALLACLSVPLWIWLYLGQGGWEMPLAPLLWHAHEMLFGFASGVIVGFLLTAVKAWTGLPTPRGPWLGALFLLWLAARLAALAGPYPLYAVLDIVLLPAVAVALLRVLIAAKNKRNMPLISLLLLMTAANAVFHLSVMGLVEVPALSALHAQLGLILLVVTVMAGRVVPMFTKNATPGLVIPATPRLDWTVFGATAVAMLSWVLALPAAWVALASAVAAVLQAVRLWRWRPQVTLQRPILWILHLSYAWLPVGLALLALAQGGWVAPSLAVHALAVGVVGGLIIGMVTRTARGHTARPLQASAGEAVAYALVLLAALVRVFAPVVAPAWYVLALQLTAALWALAFAIYLVIYTPWLTQTRADGKDG